MRLALFILCSVWLLAEDAKAPEISTQQQLAYRRAQIKQLEAQAEMQGVIADMQKTCGERLIITDPKGDPICGEAKK